MKGWTPQAAERLNSFQKPHQEPRTPAPKGKTQPAVVGERVGEEKPEDKTPPPAVAAQHYIGPYQLAVANGTHFPGRMRFAGVGPTDEGMLRAVLDAMQAYHDSKTVKP